MPPCRAPVPPGSLGRLHLLYVLLVQNLLNGDEHDDTSFLVRVPSQNILYELGQFVARVL